MTYSKEFQGYSAKRWFASPEASQSWLAIAALILVTVVGVLANVGTLFRIIYCLGCFATGLLLYFKQPALYSGFVWWSYFLTPFVTRLVDQRSGWDSQRLMLVAPLLVMLISLITFIRDAPKFYSRGGTVFFISMASLGYATLIGLINRSPFPVFRGLLDWLPSIFFGFYLFANWQYYPLYRENTKQTFLWGTLIMGVYGIYQYMVAPEWDRSWLINSEMYTSAGNPAPFEMRIWSTLHSPGTFSTILIPALTLLLNNNSLLGLSGNVLGYLSFLLTLVRSAWGSWAIGILLFLPSLKPRIQMRLFITIAILSVFIIPLATMDPFADRIGTRLQTLSNIQEDGSFNDRRKMMESLIGQALTQLLGEGLNNIGYDSGIIELLMFLGWIGGTFYMIGCIATLVKVCRLPGGISDSFAVACRTICIAMSTQFVFGIPFKGAGGMVFWGFAGLALAAQQYYRYQESNSQIQLLDDFEAELK